MMTQRLVPPSDSAESAFFCCFFFLHCAHPHGVACTIACDYDGTPDGNLLAARDCFLIYFVHFLKKKINSR